MSNVFRTQTAIVRTHPWQVCIALLVLLVLALLLWKPMSQMFSPEASVKPRALTWRLELPENTRYSFLRQADFLGNRFVMMRHNHTSQRIILLTGEPASGQTYDSLYQQPLTAFHFMVLMRVFQAQSSFHDKSVDVTEAHLEKSGVIQAKTFRLPYKTYIVNTTVDGRPEVFEAYVGKIVYGRRNQGLVFTFNSKNWVATQALTDLLDVLKPVQSPPSS